MTAGEKFLQKKQGQMFFGTAKKNWLKNIEEFFLIINKKAFAI